MAITVRELVTKLTIGGDAGTKLAKFGLTVNGVKAALDILVGSVKLVARATVGMVNDVSKAGDIIQKTSKAVGLSTKEFQRLTFAAERSGVPMTNLVKGLQNIQRNIRDATIAAGQGNKTGFVTALEQIGLRLKDLSDLNAEERIGLIGEALARVEDAGLRVALSQKLVGEEAGPKFATLLAEGRKGIRDLGDEAERLGFIMSDEGVDASAAYQDSLTKAGAVATGLKRILALSLLPFVKKSVDLFTKWALANRELIKQKLDKFFASLSKVIGVLSDNADVLFELFTNGIERLETLIDLVVSIIDAFGGLEKMLIAVTIAWTAYGVAQAIATGGISLIIPTVIGLAIAFGDVETSADRARTAVERFGKSKDADDKKVDKGLAKLDADSLVRTIRSRRDISKSLLSRLAASGANQLQATLKESGAVFTREAGSAAGRRATGKSGVTAGRGVSDSGSRENLRLLGLLIRDIEEESRTLKSVDGVDPIAKFLVGGSGSDFDEFGFRRSRLPGKKGGGKVEKTSLADLLAQAIASGKLPEEAALLASTQPPIIIPITNNNITQTIESNINVTGVPGEDGEDFSERVGIIVKAEFREEFTSALEQLRPRLVR